MFMSYPCDVAVEVAMTQRQNGCAVLAAPCFHASLDLKVVQKDAFLAVSLGEELRLEWIEQFEGHSSSRARIGTLCRVVPLETVIAQIWEIRIPGEQIQEG